MWSLMASFVVYILQLGQVLLEFSLLSTLLELNFPLLIIMGVAHSLGEAPHLVQSWFGGGIGRKLFDHILVKSKENIKNSSF